MARKVPTALRQCLQQARDWVVLSGSGVSAESGVPTFRDAQTGLWARYAPEELATPEAFAQQPGLVWDWYRWRRELIEKAAPNAGHYALAQLETKLPQLTLITQNVDGLHQRAGSRNVVEFHGNIHVDRCATCARTDVTLDDTQIGPPRCARCGGLLRPGIVWFGEGIPGSALDAAYQAAGRADLFLSVGTSSLVYPAADLGRVAMDNGATVIEINPARTPLTPRAHFHLDGCSGDWLPAIARAVGESVS